eukprot:scaffold307583_cov32-Tisochrysis_lutea.AAC.7
MSPVVAELRFLARSVAGHPQTPHEAAFQQGPGALLIESVKTFEATYATDHSGAAWAPIRRVQHEINAFSREAIPTLPRLSPKLAELCDSSISMPGLASSHNASLCEDGYAESDDNLRVHKRKHGRLDNYVLLARIDESIKVLPSKTRPKRLVMRGNDGASYTYLLKGRDDLRLVRAEQACWHLAVSAR